jgi:hypothetical protein
MQMKIRVAWTALVAVALLSLLINGSRAAEWERFAAVVAGKCNLGTAYGRTKHEAIENASLNCAKRPIEPNGRAYLMPKSWVDKECIRHINESNHRNPGADWAEYSESSRQLAIVKNYKKPCDGPERSGLAVADDPEKAKKAARDDCVANSPDGDCSYQAVIGWTAEIARKKKEGDEIARRKKEADEIARRKKEADEIARKKKEADEIARKKKEADERERKRRAQCWVHTPAHKALAWLHAHGPEIRNYWYGHLSLNTPVTIVGPIYWIRCPRCWGVHPWATIYRGDPWLKLFRRDYLNCPYRPHNA